MWNWHETDVKLTWNWPRERQQRWFMKRKKERGMEFQRSQPSRNDGFLLSEVSPAWEFPRGHQDPTANSIMSWQLTHSCESAKPIQLRETGWSEPDKLPQSYVQIFESGGPGDRWLAGELAGPQVHELAGPSLTNIFLSFSISEIDPRVLSSLPLHRTISFSLRYYHTPPLHHASIIQ